MAKHDELIVGLDIGTTKIAAIVGEVAEEGIDIIGIGTHPSRGLRKGVVTHIDNTVASIKRAVEEAELMAGCEISSVYAGIAGGHIRGFNSQGIVAVKDGEVRQSDITRVLDAAKAVAIPLDREIIHVLPQDFVVDSQDGIKEPLGMSGVRLEVKVHIVTAAVTSAQNIIKCCQRCGLQVSDLVLQPLASAEAVLHDDEKELGVALIDIGGGTTDITIYVSGSIVHTSVLPYGGNHLSNDIAVGLRTPSIEAEKIKQRWGCCLAEMVDPEEQIEVPSVGGRAPRKVPRHILCEIIEPRVEEIFGLVRAEIDRTGYHELLASGAVITGGTTILEGMPELAEGVLELPVRRGAPRGIGGLVDVVRSPKFATSVGLVLRGAKSSGEQGGPSRARADRPGIGSRMKDWFARVF
jgi:cell division protein FtsA